MLMHFRYKKMKNLFENKHSNFLLKISNSEKLLFEKLENHHDENCSELERKSKKYLKNDVHGMSIDLIKKEDESRREEKLGKETSEAVQQIEFN